MATFHATRVHAGIIIVCSDSFPWRFATACSWIKNDIVSYEGSKNFEQRVARHIAIAGLTREASSAHARVVCEEGVAQLLIWFITRLTMDVHSVLMGSFFVFVFFVLLLWSMFEKERRARLRLVTPSQAVA